MKNFCLRVLAAAIILSLVVALTSSLGARDPRSQERPLPPRAGVQLHGLSPGPQNGGSTPYHHYHFDRLPAGILTYEKFFDVPEAKYAEYDSASGIVPAGDGGIVISGSASLWPPYPGIGRSDILAMEISPTGSVIWKVVFESDPNAQCDNGSQDLIRTKDSGYLVVGSVAETDVSDHKAVVLKIGSSGGVAWIKTFNTDNPEEWNQFDLAAETADGGYVLAGGANGFWLVKLDQKGDVLWTRVMTESYYVIPGSLQATPDNGFIVSGMPSADGKMGIAKFDEDGNVQWQRVFVSDLNNVSGCDSPVYAGANCLCLTSDNGYLVAGGIGCSCGEHSCFLGGWLCRLDQYGQIIWQKGYSAFVPQRVFETKDGGVLVMDNSRGFLKLSSLGAAQWLRTTDYQNDEVYSTSAFQTDEGSYIILYENSYYTPLENMKLGVMCLDPDGSSGSSCPFPREGTISEKNLSIRSVPGDAVNFQECSVKVGLLSYAPQYRPCRSATVCGDFNLGKVSEPPERSIPPLIRQK